MVSIDHSKQMYQRLRRTDFERSLKTLTIYQTFFERSFHLQLHSLLRSPSQILSIRYSSLPTRWFRMAISKSVKVIGEESEVGDGTSWNDLSRPKKYYTNLNFYLKKQFFCVIVGMPLSAILEVLDYGSFQEMFKVGIKRYKKK